MRIVEAVLVLAMIGLSAHGALTLPPGARVPMHFGLGSFNNWVPKVVGLLVWPGIGVAVYFVFGVLDAGGARRGGRQIGITVALAVILATEAAALRLATRRSRGR